MKDFQPGDLVQNIFDKEMGLVLKVEPLKYIEEFGASWVIVLWSNKDGTTWVGRECIKLINRAEK